MFESIHKSLDYFKRYCKNVYVKNQCRIIGERLVDVENKKFSDINSVISIVNGIVKDIDNKLKKVPGLSDKMYDAMDELKSLVEQIPDKYKK